MELYNTNWQEPLVVTEKDDSYRLRKIMGEHCLTVYFDSPEFVEIPTGTYTVFQSEVYTLMSKQDYTKNGNRQYEYTLVMYPSEGILSTTKVMNPTSHKLEFPYTAKPTDHVALIVANLNRVDSGWSVGACIDAEEKVITYSHEYLSDALNKIATEFETEFEVNGKVVSLHKVEYNKDNPLALSYGKDGGVKPITRSNSDNRPTDILYVQGTDRNIDAATYGEQMLCLPKSQQIKYDGDKFEGETGYDGSKAVTYITDAYGYSVRRNGTTGATEDSLDCTEIYPSRVCTISSLTYSDIKTNDNGDEYRDWDIIDSTIPSGLDFEQYRIGGDTMTIVFQSGALAGREFEIQSYVHDSVGGKAARRFEVVTDYQDGMYMPATDLSGVYQPQVGDKFVVFGIQLPDAYICDNATKTGASWGMFRKAAKSLHENSIQKVTFTGELDGIYTKKNWLSVGGKLVLGGYIQLGNYGATDDTVLIRIVSIKEYLNKYKSPIVELSNDTVGGNNLSNTLAKVDTVRPEIDYSYKKSRSYAKRGYAQAVETAKMLDSALLDGFSGKISPISVQTMHLIAGSECLQYDFVTSLTDMTLAEPTVAVNGSMQLVCPSTYIRHATLGISDVKPIRTYTEYKRWSIAAYTSPVLSDSGKPYYLYIKASKTTTTAVWLLSETSIALEGVAGYYHLLYGFVNSETDGERSIAPMWGVSEVLPGRFTGYKFISNDGHQFIDFLNKTFRIGDNNSYIDWNNLTANALKIKGLLAVSGSGDESEVGCFRGDYVYSTYYYKGDLVTYGGSTYRYIYSSSARYKYPTNTTYWTCISAKGTDGTNGTDGSDGADGTSISWQGEFATAPSNPQDGWAYRNTTDGKSYVCFGGVWYVMTVDGQKGDTGASGSSVIYRGDYSPTATYTGSESIQNVVRYVVDNAPMYYMAKKSAGNIAGIVPTNASYWDVYGASFESIATGMLLAEEACIPNLYTEVVKAVKTVDDGAGNMLPSKSIIIDPQDGMTSYEYDSTGGNPTMRMQVTAEDKTSLDSMIPTGNATISEAGDTDQLWDTTGAEITMLSYTNSNSTSQTISVPDIYLRQRFAWSSDNIGLRVTADMQLRVYIDGLVSPDTPTGYSSSVLSFVFLPNEAGNYSKNDFVRVIGQSVPVPAGRTIQVRLWAKYSRTGGDELQMYSAARFDSKAEIDSAMRTKSVSVDGSAVISTLFGNGLFFTRALQYYIGLIAKNGGAEFLMRAANYALKFNGSGFKQSLDGGNTYVPMSPIVLVGKVTGTTSGASVTRLYNPLGLSVTVSRTAQSYYTVTHNLGNNNYEVMYGCYNTTAGRPAYVSTNAHYANYFTAEFADYDGRKDGAFTFMILQYN